MQFLISANAYYAVFYDTKYYIGWVKDANCTCPRAAASPHTRMIFLTEKFPGEYIWPPLCKTDEECICYKYIFAGPLELVGHHPFRVAGEEDVRAAYMAIKRA